MLGPGSFPNSEVLDSSKGDDAGDRKEFSGGAATVPECQDGMKLKARERLIKGVKSKNPKLVSGFHEFFKPLFLPRPCLQTYNCELAKQALSESGGSRGGTHEDSSEGTEMVMNSAFGLSFQRQILLFV